ncbi:hypothetical protein ONZ43_g6986 [Nemania bipapillata]|uniref:Uncharacterized protein n=1 Tax=Nemania bipapillata TaxID=110536 RepID=A0ACC2HUV9_9PEZI|nr:hypothetical protein ONZ43_g6986 [Nemania bipapillata]
MSSRRVPLSSNQNVANSPLRSTALKQKRTLAQLQREEPYGQQPPMKKLVLDATRERAASRQQQQQQETAAVTGFTKKDIEEIQVWKNHHRARFPKSLFYFDQIPSDVAHRLKKQIAALGGRETAFFSVDVTHVITSRTIPTEDTTTRDNGHTMAVEKESAQPEPEQAETINPSLLTRFNSTSTKRRLFDADLRARAQRIPPQPSDQALRIPKKVVDILIRARDMKKKIWNVDKLFRMTALLLETDPYRSAEMAYGPRKNTPATQLESRGAEDSNLLRLLQKERASGPSDRELTYFKGPYLYVYDIEEKQRPIMIREYNKVSDRSKGEWPQFQTAALGRCPFIEDSEVREARQAKEAAKEAQQKARAKAQSQETAAEAKPVLQPPRMAPPKPVTGKRTLGEMEMGHNRQSSVTSADFPSRSRSLGVENMDFSRKAFTSHAATGRLLGGEPVASGVQKSNMTSAIRSQMISSTATIPGVITGLSKEVHCLQRQVLKWPSAAMSRDQSSRHTAETSFREGSSTKQPPTLNRTSSRKLELINENAKENEGVEDSQSSKQGGSRKKPRDRELKPGYCENCAEKYPDFDEHIESENHRKFADNEDNWVELDDLLAQLGRMPKRQAWKPAPTWNDALEHDMFRPSVC